jgi:hypothetical protein
VFRKENPSMIDLVPAYIRDIYEKLTGPQFHVTWYLGNFDSTLQVGTWQEDKIIFIYQGDMYLLPLTPENWSDIMTLYDFLKTT